jgi:hypothetical protein
MLELEKEVTEAGITVMNEIGLDPVCGVEFTDCQSDPSSVGLISLSKREIIGYRSPLCDQDHLRGLFPVCDFTGGVAVLMVRVRSMLLAAK